LISTTHYTTIFKTILQSCALFAGRNDTLACSKTLCNLSLGLGEECLDVGVLALEGAHGLNGSLEAVEDGNTGLWGSLLEGDKGLADDANGILSGADVLDGVLDGGEGGSVTE
jgi:hypothetical protein